MEIENGNLTNSTYLPGKNPQLQTNNYTRQVNGSATGSRTNNMKAKSPMRMEVEQ